MASLRSRLGDQSDLVLVMLVIGILMVLFTPIPPELLDFLLILNFSTALMVLLLTLYVQKPLEFSTFPSLLLIATLFRLALNIAATRLILSDADAGEVIGAVGEHVVGGNYVIGMIVFLVLVVVQFVVVTNGAQRVAEVAARFTLDGMPGKQMSIDADLNMGLIDEHEAQDRRKQIEKEANFYGAMDGASKFVKGDAIAGIIIILIDIIGGLTIGIAQMGMSWGEALQTFTLLTVGDGIVTQIPALVISTGTGIIVTRASSDAFLSKEISRQVSTYPKVLAMTCAALAIFLLLPGIPAFPVLILISVLGLFAVLAFRNGPTGTADEAVEAAAPEEEDIYGLLTVDPIEVKVGQSLIPLVGGDDSLMMDRIGAFRKQHALDAGFVVPKVRVKDDRKLSPNAYQVSIYGANVGAGEILADRFLAINPGNVETDIDGVETKDPTYGLPAVWIVPEQRAAARKSGYTIVEPLTVLITHLTEMLRSHAAGLLTRAETQRLVDRVKQDDAGLVEELIPTVMSVTDVQKVLQELLREKVSIRSLNLILEVLTDVGKTSKDPSVLTELVRQRLGSLICQKLAGPDGDLHVLVLDPSVEQALSASIQGEAERMRLVVEPKLAEQVLSKLAAQAEKMMNSEMMPVLLCAPELRRHIRGLTERVMPHVSILSMLEVPTSVSVRSFGMVTL